MIITVSIDLIVPAPTYLEGSIQMDVSAILNPLLGHPHNVAYAQEALEGLLRASFTQIDLVSIAVGECLPLGSDAAQLHLDVAEFDTAMTEIITNTLNRLMPWMAGMPIVINFDGGESLVRQEISDFEIGVNIGVFMVQQAKVADERAARFYEHLDSLENYDGIFFH